jgi:hypothetical protein
MQLLEIVAYGPNTFGTIEQVVEIPKILMKMSVEDAKTSQTQKRFLFVLFLHPRAVPGIQIDENRKTKNRRRQKTTN